MSGCSVLWLLLGYMIFGFFVGSMVIYLCMSHSTSVSKSCSRGCKNLLGVVGYYGSIGSIAIEVYLW